MAWTFVSSNILPQATKDNTHIDYWMPVVAFNALTSTFVMQYWSGRCGFAKPCADIAVSASPVGPFTNAPQPLVLHSGTPSSQMGFFVDPDTGKGYVKYNTGAPQHHAVEALSDDWLSTTGEVAILLWKPTFAWMEGGGMFKHRQLYYYMTGTDCCFCTWGGDARYWTSYSPLGPWHPGLAPPLPSTPCDLTGRWSVLTAPGKAGPPSATLTLQQAAGSSNFTATPASGGGASGSGWVDQATGYATFSLYAGDGALGRGVLTAGSGAAAGCDRVRWYGYESSVWCREGAACAQPSLEDATELNYCADGSLPHQDQRLNPCDPGVLLGTNFTVPAQQFNVIAARVWEEGVGEQLQYMYYGERANSAPDRLFSHNYQAWVPLSFGADGSLQRLTFPPSFQLNLTNSTV